MDIFGHQLEQAVQPDRFDQNSNDTLQTRVARFSTAERIASA